MTDRNDDEQGSGAGPAAAPADETPLQRALRIKQAAQEAREKPPRGGRFQREQSARVKSGSSRPWMKK